MLKIQPFKALIKYNQPSSLVLNKTIHTLVFVDASLASHLPLNHAHLDGEVVLLDANRDGVEQITEVLLRYSSVQRLQIACSSSPGAIQIGSAQLNQSTLDRYREQLQTWQRILTPNASILLWGNVGMGINGMAFTGRLSQLTGAIVAVSGELSRSLEASSQNDSVYLTELLS
jgi:hypothetical protein